jgi:phosphomannomutase
MNQLITDKVINQSGIKFGTSGARGLVTQFTPNVCAAFTLSFVASMKKKFDVNKIAIAIDNRPSSYSMAQACAFALKKQNIEVVFYGVVPTPALAYVAQEQAIPAIMVTGSHIPFDRNGLKFYRPDGEITKDDENIILNGHVEFDALWTVNTELTELITDDYAALEYIKRYVDLFDTLWLKGKRIGIYQHSSAGRDLYSKIFEAFGAEVISLERTEYFVPIDTEAVAEEDKTKAINWSKEHNLDAIFSTDGDGDRPLVADENGYWLKGDILGLLCAKALNIEALAVPVSCNTSIELSEQFKFVKRTRIGSPHVIAEFNNLANDYDSVAGFEANGGFLLGSDIEINGKGLKKLPTRDAVLPAIMLLYAGTVKGIVNLVDSLPKRFTYSNRIQNFATEKSQKIIKEGIKEPKALLNKLGFNDCDISSIDKTDGLRITLGNNTIIHIRPSGNAPELRSYVEAEGETLASSICTQVLMNIQK